MVELAWYDEPYSESYPYHDQEEERAAIKEGGKAMREQKNRRRVAFVPSVPFPPRIRTLEGIQKTSMEVKMKPTAGKRRPFPTRRGR